MSIAGKLLLLSALTLGMMMAADNASVISTFRPTPAFPRDVLTNEGIVSLADAGFSDSFIVEKILISNDTHFDTSVEGLTYLRRNAVSEELVRFLMEHAAKPLTAPSAPVMPVVIAGKEKHQKRALKQTLTASVASAVIMPAAVPEQTFVRPALYNQSDAVLPAGLWTGAPYSNPRAGFGSYGYPASSGTPILLMTPQQSASRHWWRWW